MTYIRLPVDIVLENNRSTMIMPFYVIQNVLSGKMVLLYKNDGILVLESWIK